MKFKIITRKKSGCIIIRQQLKYKTSSSFIRVTEYFSLIVPWKVHKDYYHHAITINDNLKATQKFLDHKFLPFNMYFCKLVQGKNNFL